MKRFFIIACLFCGSTLAFSPLQLLAKEAGDGEVQGNVESAAPLMPDLLGGEDDWESGFAGGENGDGATSRNTISDPLEPMNRVFFAFNNEMYDWVLKPVADGYAWVVPYELRDSFGNLFKNIGAPIRLVNSLLQGEFKKSWVVTERFLINSTLGVFGMTDVAQLAFDLEPQQADFGQTLGVWGVGSGPYICWPFFGPSLVRESVGFSVDGYAHPITYFDQSWSIDIGYYALSSINSLSLDSSLVEDLRRLSLDPYVATRQAYYDYRVNLIENNSVQSK